MYNKEMDKLSKLKNSLLSLNGALMTNDMKGVVILLADSDYNYLENTLESGFSSLVNHYVKVDFNEMELCAIRIKRYVKGD